MSYILGIDQSTQGTKALLFDENGALLGRRDRRHAQKISREGWVSHDPMEIYRGTIDAVRALLDQTGVDGGAVAAVGISNQRETALLWDRDTGLPAADAVVWQCSRAADSAGALRTAPGRSNRRRGSTYPRISRRQSGHGCSKTRRGFPEKRLCAGTIDKLARL